MLIHQPSYSLLNRWIERELLGTLEAEGVGCIAFSALAQGLLSTKYLKGVPDDARIRKPGGGSLQERHLSPDNLARVKALNDIAQQRGQSLPQMALAWALRDPRVTTALIGASSAEQLRENVGALKQMQFSDEELKRIDAHAQEGGIDLWQASSTDQAF